MTNTQNTETDDTDAEQVGCPDCGYLVEFCQCNRPSLGFLIKYMTPVREVRS